MVFKLGVYFGALVFQQTNVWLAINGFAINKQKANSSALSSDLCSAELLIELCLQSWAFPNTQRALRDSQLRRLDWASWKAEAVVVWVNVWLAEKWLSSQISLHEPAIGGGRSVRGLSMDAVGVPACRRLWMPFPCWLLAVEWMPGGAGSIASVVQPRQICLSSTSAPLYASKIACYSIPFKVMAFSILCGFSCF